MRMKRSLILVSVLSLFAFLLGGTWTFLLSESSTREVYDKLRLFAKVYDLVKRQYVEEPKDETLVQGAIRGMLEGLDPHSAYMTKEEFAEMQSDSRGEFGGLGIEISKKNGFLTVITPMEDTPAFQAGIKPNDIIVKINDQTTDKMSIFDAVKLMRGKPGTVVEIWVKREGRDSLIPFKLKRAKINVKSVSSKVVDGFLVIKLKQFMEKSADEVRKILEEAHKKGEIKGLVLDLRNNPGGLLQQAVEISDLFLEKGLIVYTQGRDKVQTDKKFAVAKGTEPNYPLVVLINGGSASASEIVSGALQDQDPPRAHIMGTQSFGKGSVQNVIPLEDGSGIKITIALYYTPKNRQIQGLGITPDEIVEPLEEAFVGGIREKDLPGHIVGVNEKPDVKPAEETSKAKPGKKVDASKLTPLEKEDYQLAKAVDYLKRQGSSPKK